MLSPAAPDNETCTVCKSKYGHYMVTKGSIQPVWPLMALPSTLLHFKFKSAELPAPLSIHKKGFNCNLHQTWIRSKCLEYCICYCVPNILNFKKENSKKDTNYKNIHFNTNFKNTECSTEKSRFNGSRFNIKSWFKKWNHVTKISFPLKSLELP